MNKEDILICNIAKYANLHPYHDKLVMRRLMEAVYLLSGGDSYKRDYSYFLSRVNLDPNNCDQIDWKFHELTDEVKERIDYVLENDIICKIRWI